MQVLKVMSTHWDGNTTTPDFTIMRLITWQGCRAAEDVGGGCKCPTPLKKHECGMRLAHPDTILQLARHRKPVLALPMDMARKLLQLHGLGLRQTRRNQCFQSDTIHFYAEIFFARETKGQHVIDKVWHDYRLHLDHCHKNIWRTRQVSLSRPRPMQWFPRLLSGCCGCQRQRPIRLVNISFLLHGLAKI